VLDSSAEISGDSGEPRGSDQFDRLTDGELLSLVSSRDRAAFEALYDRHRVVAFSLAYRLLNSRDQAEDVTQEAFLGLWRDAGRYEPELGSVRTWLMTIVRNRSLDAVRRRSARDRKHAAAAELPADLSAADVTSAEAYARDEGRTIRAALSELPDDQRRVVELAFFGGWTQTEIADMLGMPLGTVKSRIRLGLIKLRTLLDEGQTS
jgi:RNA polymerase sigma-70 factor (ECF subfamily)